MGITEKMRSYFDKGISVSKTALDKSVEVSKKALNKAGTVVQDFSDKSVIRIEKHQFEVKRDEQYTNLGKMIAEEFIGGKRTAISVDDTVVSAALAEITHLDDEIAKRQTILSAAE